MLHIFLKYEAALLRNGNITIYKIFILGIFQLIKLYFIHEDNSKKTVKNYDIMFLMENILTVN